MSMKAKWEAANQQIRDLTERLRKASAAATTMRLERDQAKAEALANWERLGEANHRTLEAMAELAAFREFAAGMCKAMLSDPATPEDVRSLATEALAKIGGGQ